jgi:hypothetical protein
LKNDYDTIADSLGDVLAELVGNAHEPRHFKGDSMTITKDGFLTAAIRIQRLRDWVEGLAASHRHYEVDTSTGSEDGT